jgi:AbrB family looped-hinge helix DNA binding protein
MVTTTLSQKGQVVIPQEVRNKLRLHPGDDFIVLWSQTGDILLRPVRNSSDQDWLDALGGLKGLAVPTRSKELGRKVVL